MTEAQHFAAVLRLGDDALVLGQRLSAWCGHGPILEEDIALSNIALDLIGQARNFFTLAGKLENQGRDEDALAYFRSDREFQNHLLVEQPNGHFGDTVVRQMFFSAFALDRYAFLGAPNRECGRGGHRRQSGEGTALPLGARRAMGHSTRRRHP